MCSITASINLLLYALATPCIDSGESIFDKEFLRKSEGKIAKALKVHGNEADFLGFLQKSVPHESLTLPFEPFGLLHNK
jgi:hypothetical protein